MATAPTQVTQYQTGFAPEIAPYMQNLLGQAAARAYTYKTDASGQPVLDSSGMPVITGFQPYQQYTGQRNAQFTPLQKTAFTDAAALGVDTTTSGAASALGRLAESAGNTAYRPTTAANQFQGPTPYDTSTSSFNAAGTANSYMSPYMQNVVDVQTQEAKRQAALQNAGIAAAAAKAGSRSSSGRTMAESEARRNLNTQLGAIQAQGSQNAFQNAQQQFNTEQQAAQQARQFGAGQGLTAAQLAAQYGLSADQLNAQQNQYAAGLGLQGLQAGMSGYNMQGGLGQNIYGQRVGNINLQNQLGTQQQQNVQDILNTQYQNWQNQQNFPYQQMSYLNEMIRGAPMSQQSSSMYQAAPSMASTVAGLGTAGVGAYGMYKGMTRSAKGGPIKEKTKAGLAHLLIHKMA